MALVHLATCADEARLAQAPDDALHRGLTSVPQMRWALDTLRGVGHGGTLLLRALVADRSSGVAPPESELEAAFYSLIDASDLPPGTRKAQLSGPGGGLRVDLFWEDAGLIVEVDGWDTHGTREDFQRDRERDRIYGHQGDGDDALHVGRCHQTPSLSRRRDPPGAAAASSQSKNSVGECFVGILPGRGPGGAAP